MGRSARFPSYTTISADLHVLRLLFFSCLLSPQLVVAGARRPQVVVGGRRPQVVVVRVGEVVLTRVWGVPFFLVLACCLQGAAMAVRLSEGEAGHGKVQRERAVVRD